jgi:hypothetical protein
MAISLKEYSNTLLNKVLMQEHHLFLHHPFVFIRGHIKIALNTHIDKRNAPTKIKKKSLLYNPVKSTTIALIELLNGTISHGCK